MGAMKTSSASGRNTSAVAVATLCYHRQQRVPYGSVDIFVTDNVAALHVACNRLKERRTRALRQLASSRHNYRKLIVRQCKRHGWLRIVSITSVIAISAVTFTIRPRAE